MAVRTDTSDRKGMVHMSLSGKFTAENAGLVDDEVKALVIQESRKLPNSYDGTALWVDDVVSGAMYILPQYLSGEMDSANAPSKGASGRSLGDGAMSSRDVRNHRITQAVWTAYKMQIRQKALEDVALGRVARDSLKRNDRLPEMSASGEMATIALPDGHTGENAKFGGIRDGMAVEYAKGLITRMRLPGEIDPAMRFVRALAELSETHRTIIEAVLAEVCDRTDHIRSNGREYLDYDATEDSAGRPIPPRKRKSSASANPFRIAPTAVLERLTGEKVSRGRKTTKFAGLMQEAWDALNAALEAIDAEVEGCNTSYVMSE